MNVIVTICIGDLGYAKHTLSSIKRYADRIGCDFKIIDHRKYPTWGSPKWEIFQITDFLDKYDRVLYLDADILITEEAPDIFEEVDTDGLGCVLEETGKVANTDHRYVNHILRYFYTERGAINPNYDAVDYLNSGVLLLSQCHRDLFQDKSEKTRKFFNKYKDFLQDQTYINYNVDTRNIKLHPISRRYNFLVRPQNLCKWIEGYPMVSHNIVLQNDVAFLHFVGPLKEIRLESYFKTIGWPSEVDRGHTLVDIDSERWKYV